MAGRRLNGLLLAGLAVMLVLIGVLGAASSRQQDEDSAEPALSIYSNDSNGARALYLWLRDLGFRTTSIERQVFDVPEESRLLFVLAPRQDPEQRAVDVMLDWVRRGGTLVHVARSRNRLLDALDIRISRVARTDARFVPLQPTFTRPPLTAVDASGRWTLTSSNPAWVRVLGNESQTIAMERQLGAGRIIVLSVVEPMSNSGLRTGENWKLVANLLADLPPGAPIAFDEYHHGLTESGTLSTLLVRQPWGWAILYAAVATFMYLVLSGRRFGRPLSPLPEGTRRTRGEYVLTMGGLLHQGNHRAWLRERYVRQVKRALAQRFRVSPEAPAAALAEAVAKRRPTAARLVEPLRRLEGPELPSEREILHLIREVEAVRSGPLKT